jgi:septal ring factor EnvC (AmiA/AmiB activator)
VRLIIACPGFPHAPPSMAGANLGDSMAARISMLRAILDSFINTFTKLQETKTKVTETREETIAAIKKLQTDTKPTVASSEDVKALQEARRKTHLHEETLARLNMYLECVSFQLISAEEHLSTILELEEASLKMNEGGKFDIEQVTKMISLQREVMEGMEEERSKSESVNGVFAREQDGMIFSHEGDKLCWS